MLVEKKREYLQLWDTLIRMGENPGLLGLFMAEQARDVSACTPLSEIVFRVALIDLRGE